MEVPLNHVTTSTVFVNPISCNTCNATLASKEEVELLELSNSEKGLKHKPEINKWKFSTKRKPEEDGEEGDYEDLGKGNDKEYPEDGAFISSTQKPTRLSSYDSLVESLTVFLGSPNRASSRNRTFEKEVDFGDLSELNTVRQLGKGANIPQDVSKHVCSFCLVGYETSLIRMIGFSWWTL